MKRLPAVLTSALLASILAPTTSALSLRLTSSSGTTTIDDNGAGDTNPAIGVVDAAGVPGYLVSVNIGVNNSGALILPYPDLHLSAVATTQPDDSSTLKVELTHTGYSGSPAVFISALGGVVGAAPGSELTYETYLDDSNAAFGTTTLLSSLGAFGPGAFSDTDSSSSQSPTDPYSVTMVLELTHGGIDSGLTTSSVDATLSTNPRNPPSGEPVPDGGSSLVLLGLGAASLALFRRGQRA